jgi:nucleoside-diphosphate-sugar epimerase
VNVRDVAEANYNAAAVGVTGPFNIARGDRVTIKELVRMMYEIVGGTPHIEHGPPRKGDVRHSLADISRASAAFGYRPSVDLYEGLQEYLTWTRQDAPTA